MPLRRSHLREVSTNSPNSDNVEGALRDAFRGDVSATADVDEAPPLQAPQLCTLGIHDDSFSKLEVLVNRDAFPSDTVPLGASMHIFASTPESARQSYKRRTSHEDHFGAHYRRSSTRHHDSRTNEISYVFVVQEMPPELLTRHPNLEISINQNIASALGFKNRSQVSLTQVDGRSYSASHVEIAFRDAYLTRADMWRLVVSELAGKSMYRGQKLSFMTTIKAQVKTIYQAGAKRQSAFFGKDTKPIFRSESARYVLFIQMSREMWGFDTDGTGEVMFHKVVDGFLPELFRRWEDIGAHHLVSIILFTRMEYDQPLVASLESSDPSLRSVFAETGADVPRYRDFYRVLVSDMASGQWAAIIHQLKRDFKTFLRDVSINLSRSASTVFLGQDGFSATSVEPREVISGRPTAASQGNILEAISVASSQFSGDYIDRDLVRTGLSIIVVTPGTGLFEVDYSLLGLTTDVLIENGISIDLVCLSRMPLHSVPLFKYKGPATVTSRDIPEIRSGIYTGSETPQAESYQSTGSVITSSPGFGLGTRSDSADKRPDYIDQWSYGIPHWVDVSFWTPTNASASAGGSLRNRNLHSSKKEFVPRVKMYEVQMMGIMQNELCNISIPYLRKPIAASRLRTKTLNVKSKASNTDAQSSTKTGKTLEPSSLKSDGSVLSRSASPTYRDMKELGGLFDWADQYDEAVFKPPLAPRDRNNHRKPLTGTLTRSTQHSRSNSEELQTASKPLQQKPPQQQSEGLKTSPTVTKPMKPTSGLSILEKTPATKGKMPRQISLGLRGLGGLIAKATPVTELSSTTAHWEATQTRLSRTNSYQTQSTSRPSSVLSSDTTQTQESEHPVDKHDPPEPRSSEEASQPIAIRQVNRDGKEVPPMFTSLNPKDDIRIAQLQDKLPASKIEVELAPVQLGLSPRKAMAPWLTVLNPCNPSSNYAEPRMRLGRWHHVFPRPLHASHMKWKSLCSPASVPLTTEDFPTPEQLKTEYDEMEYTVNFSTEGNLWEDGTSGKWLARELVSARCSHGFQVVLSDAAAVYFGLPLVSDFTIYDDANIGKIGSQIIMLRGPNIHKLLTVDTGLVQVTIYHRRPADVSGNTRNDDMIYRPFVRTTLSDKYHMREIHITSTKEAYDWQRLDNFIAGHEAKRNNAYPNLLNFWRARYVLIPLKKPSNPKRRPPINEDDDEEIRLEGIRKITQLWQKHRYISPEERRFEGAKPRKAEYNPLDIIYRTMKPSAIVAAEVNVLENEGMEGKSTQLLPESELLERANLNIVSLAQTIQSEKGIRIANRRWHWRLHYNCFIGLELTTWLLNNFRDIDTREEAEELGNELMKEGLFVHVEKRHTFRDGNFFYQIAHDHLVKRETKSSWFGRSVPSTPATDSRNGSGGARPKSGADQDEESDGQITPPAKQRLGVALSKSLIYDVDHRKRSYRPELMVLHYDRISSADDCYHLRIDWMNVTPKLIEDAIASWASLAERNGLRLVELPIAEACRINEYHPFRGPYIVRLAKAPPETQPQTYFDSTSLAPKASSKYIYHEAILKKFDFVLDLETATDFPPNVEVSYSWGKPDYAYSQYISRTGVILAQITDEGHFLLLANRLYNNRTAGVAEVQRASHRAPPSEASHRQSPARQPAARMLVSPRGSPSPSPMMHAVPDVGPGFAKLDAITPEKIKDELESFCSDVAALEKFYDELLKQTVQPGLMTPMMDSIVTALAPPPALSLRDDVSAG